MTSYRNKISTLINFINTNAYLFRDNNDDYFKVFHSEFEKFSIDAYQSNKTLRLIFSDKKNTDLFGIKQIDKSF